MNNLSIFITKDFTKWFLNNKKPMISKSTKTFYLYISLYSSTSTTFMAVTSSFRQSSSRWGRTDRHPAAPTATTPPRRPQLATRTRSTPAPTTPPTSAGPPPSQGRCPWMGMATWWSSPTCRWPRGWRSRRRRSSWTFRGRRWQTDSWACRTTPTTATWTAACSAWSE